MAKPSLSWTTRQFWQQTEYDYTYFYVYLPEITIYLTSSGCRMKVGGEEETLLVKLINFEPMNLDRLVTPRLHNWSVDNRFLNDDLFAPSTERTSVFVCPCRPRRYRGCLASLKQSDAPNGTGPHFAHYVQSVQQLPHRRGVESK